jgi:hypothetical protein
MGTRANYRQDAKTRRQNFIVREFSLMNGISREEREAHERDKTLKPNESFLSPLWLREGHL